MNLIMPQGSCVLLSKRKKQVINCEIPFLTIKQGDQWTLKLSRL